MNIARVQLPPMTKHGLTFLSRTDGQLTGTRILFEWHEKSFFILSLLFCRLLWSMADFFNSPILPNLFYCSLFSSALTMTSYFKQSNSSDLNILVKIKQSPPLSTDKRGHGLHTQLQLQLQLQHIITGIFQLESQVQSPEQAISLSDSHSAQPGYCQHQLVDQLHL